MKPLDFRNTRLSYPLQHMVDAFGRDGFAIEQIPGTNIFTVEKGNIHLFFIEAFSNAIPYNIGIMVTNKFYGKRIMQDAGIPVAPGKKFVKEERYDALLYAQEIGFPVVIRLNSVRSTQRGFTNIRGKQEFIDAFQSIAEEDSDLLVEKQQKGKSFRVLVTRDGYWNVLQKHIPAITGDGISTIRQLVLRENIKRMSATELGIQMLDVDVYCKIHGIDQDSILPLRKHLVFADFVSAAAGATFSDVTSKAHADIHEMAQQVLGALPGVGYIGFEILGDIEKGRDMCIVSEIYISPGPNLFYSLYKGKDKIMAMTHIQEILMTHQRA